MEEFSMQAIGYIRSPFQETKQVPKGLGAKHTTEGELEVLPEFAEGLKDIEGFSHIAVIWIFHRAEGYELISTPPSDDKPHGVFATRTPRRPNPIGLSVVELIRREGPRLYLKGIDMVDGTPVLDIKPYTSSIPEEQLRRGWLAEAEKLSKNLF
jgi:tRNA-Thr(GGU) m(6)t(6)A37 methyltransferase TsaA